MEFDVYEERNRCYELLGLAPGASAGQLKAAHRDLVKVWHPDRFAHDPRLQQKAQEKLKEINEAYELLAAGREPRRPQPAADEGRHAPARATPSPSRARWPSVLLAALVCCAALALVSRVLWTRGAAPDTATGREPAAASPRDEQPAAAGQPAQTKKRPERETTDAPVKKVDDAPAPQAAAAPALPTVTVLIDPTTGLVATPACPVRSRTTFAEGREPRRPCDAHRKKSAPSDVDKEERRDGK